MYLSKRLLHVGEAKYISKIQISDTLDKTNHHTFYQIYLNYALQIEIS